MSDGPGCTWCVPLYIILLPKVVGGLSVLCSAYLIKTIVDEKNRTAYHRIMVNLSLLDILFSALVHFVGSWAMPVGTAPLSAGNLRTCDAQGFFALTFMMACPLCNASLSTYYNLVITKQWSEARIRKIEKWLHIIPLAIGVLTGIVPLIAKLYIPGTWGCWYNYNPYPLGCDSADTCERGWNAQYYFWPIFLLLCVGPTYVAYSMYLVWRYVRNLEKRVIKYQSTRGLSEEEQREQERKNTAKSRKVMEQSLLYSGALFWILIFAVISFLLSYFGVPVPHWILTAFAIAGPSQGILNLGIHLRRTGQIPSLPELKSPFRSLKRSNTSATQKTPPNSSIGPVSEVNEEAKQEEAEDGFVENG